MNFNPKLRMVLARPMYGAYKTAYQQLNAEAYAQAGKSDALEADAKAYAGKMTAASASSVSKCLKPAYQWNC